MMITTEWSVLPDAIATRPKGNHVQFLHAFGFGSGGEDEFTGQVEAQSLGVVASVATSLVPVAMLFEALLWCMGDR